MEKLSESPGLLAWPFCYFAQFLGIDLEISSLSSSTNSKPIEYCREVRMQSD
jgi:hypothetical protein